MTAVDIGCGLGERALQGHLEIFHIEIEKTASMNHLPIFRLIVGNTQAMPLTSAILCGAVPISFDWETQTTSLRGCALKG
jgi:hypothetical protein